MKAIFGIVFLFLTTLTYSQNKADEPIYAANTLLAKAELITELVKDIPTDCKVTGYIFSYTPLKGKPYKINCVGNELRLEIQNLFKKSKEGDKFWFDKLETACLEKHKTKYYFKVTKGS